MFFPHKLQQLWVSCCVLLVLACFSLEFRVSSAQTGNCTTGWTGFQCSISTTCPNKDGCFTYSVSNVMTNLESSLYDVAIDPMSGDYLVSVVGYIYRINSTTLVKTVFAGDGTQGLAVNYVSVSGARFHDARQLFATNNYVKLFANGTLTIFAGTLGQPGYGGDGGPATSALLRFPQSVAYNSILNELYIVDRHNHAIRKVDMNGIINTVAGNGLPGAPGYFNVQKVLFKYPVEMTFHGSKPEFLIIDTDNQVLRKLTIGCGSSKSYFLSSAFSKCLPQCYNKKGDNPSVCRGHGTCIAPNQCKCNVGYYSRECDLYQCNGILFNDTQVCSGRGTCYGPENCTCNPNYGGQFCENHYCNGILNSSSSVCSGHGICSSPNNCTCNAGYYGKNCEMNDCNVVPFNSSSVCNNGSGICIGPNTCQCNSGYYGFVCSEPLCFGIPASNRSVCGFHGKCIAPNLCQCENSQWVGFDCSVPTCFQTEVINGTLQCKNESQNSDIHSIIKQQFQVETLTNVTQLDSKNVTFDNFQNILVQFPSNISKQISNDVTSGGGGTSMISLVVTISQNVTALKEEVRQILSPIVKIVLSKGNGDEIQVKNLTHAIEISFPNVTNQSELGCVYFDEIQQEWSPEGIVSKYDSISQTMKCWTSHLTSFAVIDMNFKKTSNKNNPKPPSPTPPPSFSVQKEERAQVESAAAIAATVSVIGALLVCGVIVVITIVIVMLSRRAKKKQEI
ncbi:hypothetical protein FDP41_006543 [Naegleria fowleri]|uniref:EGF-like domain-containing protein n=1 Tax=Naegleria fowleri TaxID=5763 RepID=A0A6A5BJC9_NAEFO|nr:uncharacterized protein FDP41_006543 [Naegleria fowleri]KAF0974511.1 hypothetical protein FDP41_006543 [Naegleria fowleri]